MNNTEDSEDPFSTENAPKVSLVVQMRMYDALMALLSVQDPEMAAKLHEVHANGKIVGALPYLDMMT